MWNDPGSPWHAQTGGPLLCIYTFLYGAERDRGQTLWGGKGKTLHWATKQNVFVSPPPHSQRESNQEGGDDTSARTEKRSVSSRMLQVVLYSQEGPITSGLTQQGRGRKPDQPAGFRRRSPSALDDCFKRKADV